jgi:hypothetical protein
LCPQTLTIYNSATADALVGGSSNLIVSSTGYIVWNVLKMVETRCALDITYYPFDRQVCNITFSKWVENDLEVRQQTLPASFIHFLSFSSAPTGDWYDGKGSPSGSVCSCPGSTLHPRFSRSFSTVLWVCLWFFSFEVSNVEHFFL